MKSKTFSYLFHPFLAQGAFNSTKTVKVFTKQCFPHIINVRLNSTFFWDATACKQVEVYRRFGGAYCLQLQGRRVGQATITINVNKKFWKELIAHFP
jgi:hypothetical protein